MGLIPIRKNKFFIKYDKKKVVNFILNQKINIIGGYLPINHEFNCLDILDQLSKKKDSNKADAILIASYFHETYKNE